MMFFLGINWKTATKVIIVATVVGLIGYDIYVYIEPTEGDTISEVTLAWAWTNSFVPFALGVLGGHFTWPRKIPLIPKIQSVIALAMFGMALIVLDLLKLTPDIMPIFYFLPGILAGHYFWPQRQLKP